MLTATAATGEAQQAFAVVEGAPYYVELSVTSVTAGSLTVAVGGAGGTEVISEAGTYYFPLTGGVATTSFFRLIGGSGFSGTIDYAILYPALPDLLDTPVQDNGGLGNHAGIQGLGSYIPFNSPCDDISGVNLLTSADTIVITGPESAVMTGYQSSDGGNTWLYREGTQFFNYRYINGSHIISGSDGLSMCYAKITLNG